MIREATTGRAKKAVAPKTGARSNRTRDTLETIALSAERAAIALETIAALLSCAIEPFEPQTPGGDARCVFRTYEREFQPSYG